MASERLVPGTIIVDRYEIVAIIGSGGMGSVYRARDSRLDTTVAVKELNNSLLPEDIRDQAILSFRNEARLLAQLSQRHLPKVTDFFVHRSRCYLVMEYIVGITLDHALTETNDKLPIYRVLHWGIQIAEALQYLHAQDPPIIFRDLKPSNIMVEENDQIKLIDFGIARRFDSQSSQDTLLYGSPGYSPPEQYGYTQTTPQSDIYAFGATLHHLLTGRDPARSPFKFPSISSLRDVPYELNHLIISCLEMDREKRPNSIQDVKKTLEGILQSMPNATELAHPNITGPTKKSSFSVITKKSAHPSMRPLLIGIILFVLIGGAYSVFKLLLNTKGSETLHTAIVQSLKPPATQGESIPTPSVSQTTSTTLRINSSLTGCSVQMDGQYIGVSPCEIPDVPPGNHFVEVIPPTNSGFAPSTREIQTNTNQGLIIMEMDLAPLAADTSNQAEAVEMNNISSEYGEFKNRVSSSGTNSGALIDADFRILHATGKDTILSVFFYGPDPSTPMVPTQLVQGYYNSSGQLSYSHLIHPDSDTADFHNITLFIPNYLFSLPFNKVYYRVVIFIEGKIVWQSDVRSIMQVGSGG